MTGLTNKEFKRLCEIDDKLLDDFLVTKEEREERMMLIAKLTAFINTQF